MTFFCGRSLGGGRKIPLTSSLTLAMKSVSLFILTITGKIQILPAYIRPLTVRDCDCYLKRLTLTDETRLAEPAQALTQRMVDLKAFPMFEQCWAETSYCNNINICSN